MRRPSTRVEDIRDSVFDVIDRLTSTPIFEIKRVDVIAVASATVSAPLISSAFTKLEGAIQIASTANEQAYVTNKDTKSLNVSWDFGASTSGKQTVTFLLIGS